MEKIRVPPTTINLTISGHTAQRAEFCLQLIENALEQKGLTKPEVDHILKQIISLKFKDMKQAKGCSWWQNCWTDNLKWRMLAHPLV